MNVQVSNAAAKKGAGFSLLEVVIATGLCAGAVGAVLGMLPPLLAAITDAEQRARALHIVGALDARLTAAPWAEVVSSLDSGEVWYADSSGSRLGTATDPVWDSAGETMALRDGAKRFELVAVRDTPLSGPAVLVYVVVVRWPAYTGDGRRITDRSLQNSLVLHGSRTR